MNIYLFIIDNITVNLFTESIQMFLNYIDIILIPLPPVRDYLHKCGEL